MTVLVWNVRGLNKPTRRRDVKNHIQLLSPSIVALLETKVKEQFSARILSFVFLRVGPTAIIIPIVMVVEFGSVGIKKCGNVML